MKKKKQILLQLWQNIQKTLPWQNREFQFTAGGDHSLFNVISLILIGIFNIINQLTNHNALKGLWFSGPLFALAILIYIVPFRKIILSYIFILLAVPVHFSMQDPSGFSAISLFVLAYSNNKKIYFGALILFISTVAIAIKSSISNDTPTQTMMTIALFVFIYGNFWDSIFKYMTGSMQKNLKALTKEENKFLQLRCEGKAQGEAGYELGHKDKFQTSKMMKDIRAKLEVKDTEANSKVLAIYMRYVK